MTPVAPFLDLQEHLDFEKLASETSACLTAGALKLRVVQLFVRLTAAPRRERELADALRAMKRQVQGRRGCSAVHVAADFDDTDVR